MKKLLFIILLSSLAQSANICALSILPKIFGIFSSIRPHFVVRRIFRQKITPISLNNTRAAKKSFNEIVGKIARHQCLMSAIKYGYYNEKGELIQKEKMINFPDEIHLPYKINVKEKDLIQEIENLNKELEHSCREWHS